MKAIKYLEKRSVYLFLCVRVCVCLCVCVCVCCHAFINYKGTDYAFFISFHTIKKAER